MKREDFCFRSFIFSFLSHRKHRTVKGVEEILRRKFPCDAQLKSYTYQSLRVKPLEISYSLVNFFSVRDAVLLVTEDFALTEELGNSPVRIAYTVRNMIALKNLNPKFPTVACAA